MKNIAENHSKAESYSAGEAAALLGVSIPTLKRMAAEGRVQGFRTPGGHLRILGESVEAVKERRPTQTRPVRDASPVLQNRRERLEELTLDAQEVRAQRELAKLHREEQEEAERREAEAQAREDEAARREAELDLERERLEHEQEQERMRQEREEAQERRRGEADQALAAFRCRWLDKANEAVAGRDYAWLSAAQCKETLEGLEAEIEKRQPGDEPRMDAIVARNLKALVEPFRVERDTQERRQRLTERTLWSLPYYATEAERARATIAVREALQESDAFADECEMRVTAEEAVRRVRQAIERRMLDARLINWAIGKLPWGRTDLDEARIRRECTEILADLPIDVSEVEAKEALESTVREARQEIELRQAEKQRQARKANLIQQGAAEVFIYLSELKQADEISAADYCDTDFNADLKEAVQRGLDAGLTGEESTKKVRELAREIIDGELA